MALMMNEDSGQQISRKTPTAQAKSFNPAAAALLSLLVAGAGQMYKGEIKHGLVWLVVVKGCYAAGLLMLFLFGSHLAARSLLLLGIFLHLACVVDAAGGVRKGTPVASPS